MTAKNARRNRKAPSIREREGEALVTLTDSVSGFRRDYRLGAYGSAKSRAAYHMLIADWEARERRLPPPLRAPTRRTYNPVRLEGDRGPTVTQLIADYYTWARGYYSEPDVLRDRVLNRETDGFRDLTVSIRINREAVRDAKSFEKLIDTSDLAPSEVAQTILAVM